jgi:sulfatase maturation enzyme AslB (radical SAM superfamily)
MTDINKDVYCPMIHGGLSINLVGSNQKTAMVDHCCLRHNDIAVNIETNIWNTPALIPLRQLNNQNIWDSACWACQKPELSGISSLRTGTLEKYGIRKNLAGPVHLQLNFDSSCNLACRTCGPDQSTYWQKHLKENNMVVDIIPANSRVDDVIAILKTLDLTNLEMVVIAGGESLMSKGYWQVAELIAKLVPNAKEKLTLSFQTNGTQYIEQKYYPIIEKFHLVKLHFSIDAVADQFEYLRWPAKWSQVTDNMYKLRDSLPANVMFLIEETVSIFNLYYQNELDDWVKTNYSTNRMKPSELRPDGDITNHQRHLAFGIYGLTNLTQKYVDSIKHTSLINLLDKNWKEDPINIKKMIIEIQKFDVIRQQDFTKTFPEIAEFYSEYLR